MSLEKWTKIFLSMSRALDEQLIKNSLTKLLLELEISIDNTDNKRIKEKRMEYANAIEIILRTYNNRK